MKFVDKSYYEGEFQNNEIHGKGNFFILFQENMSGSKTESMKEIGSIIVCMEKEKLHGLMEDVMKANTNMIRNMDLVHSSGQMEENMLDIGKMENSMEEVNIFFRTERKKLDNG